MKMITHHQGQGKRTKKEITAGFIVYRKTQEGPKFLLLYHRGSYWNFPKGHIESEPRTSADSTVRGREKSLEAALRETREETGLSRHDLRIVPGFKAYERFYFRKGDQPTFKTVIFYLAETRRADVKISFEHNGYGWFLHRDAKKMVAHYRDTQRVLEQAYHFLQARRLPIHHQR